MPRIAVVIPCFRVRKHILGVLSAIGSEVDAVYVVDDACPDESGTWVEAECRDERVRVLRNPSNLGVGGATLAGWRAALDEGAEIIVKCDGDGQMDPARIPQLIAPILAGRADYTKGNRFFEIAGLSRMPPLRLFGNAVLSFASKLSSGYWNIFDPTNGFVAIHAALARRLPLERIDAGWLFESDLLFRLGTLRAVIEDVPMPASYGDEESSLRIGQVIPRFLGMHLRNTLKRIFYTYYLRDFNVASIELLAGLLLAAFGSFIGVTRWMGSEATQIPQTSGTVMLAALPLIVGVQLILSFLNYDLQNVPHEALHRRLGPPHA